MKTDDDINIRAERARKGSPFLTTAQAAFYLGLCRQTLEKMRHKGRGPRFRKHGRHVRYHIADLDAWSRMHGIDPGADPNAQSGKARGPRE
jgi:excisionase family DNA binding protein